MIRWLDSLRVFALLLVLGYHFFIAALPGGFLGVDVFFTLSGYLTTGLILRGVAEGGGFCLLAFYRRRFMRIFPPLFFSVLFTLPFFLLLHPDFSISVGRRAAAAVGLVTNWYQIQAGTGYEMALLPSLYNHTWFVAVEAQICLLWGALAAAVLLLAGLAGKKTPRLFRAAVFAVSLTIAAVSYAFMQRMFDAGADLSAIYFNTLARMFPFFIGSAAAAVWGVSERLPGFLQKRGRLAAAAAALLGTGFMAAIALFAASLDFGHEFAYRFGFLLVSLLAVGLIYAAKTLHEAAEGAREPRAVKIASNLSYNIYLYHWPFYIVASGLIAGNALAALAATAVSLAFSAMMLFMVEPLLRPAGPGRKSRPAALSASVMSAAALALGVPVIVNEPPITSIESDFMAGYVSMDAERIRHAERMAGRVNARPVMFDADYTESAIRGLLGAEPDPEPEPGQAPEPTPRPTPQPTPTPRPTPMPMQVTVIGDSVTVGAMDAIRSAIPYSHIDATVSRQIAAGGALMYEMQQNGQLSEYVVIALGTNFNRNYPAQLAAIAQSLNPGHRLIFVTPFSGRPGSSSPQVAEFIRGLEEQYDFVTVADWHAAISEAPHLLSGDRIHMGGAESRQLFASVIKEAVERASERPAKGR